MIPFWFRRMDYLRLKTSRMLDIAAFPEGTADLAHGIKGLCERIKLLNWILVQKKSMILTRRRRLDGRGEYPIQKVVTLGAQITF